MNMDTEEIRKAMFSGRRPPAALIENLLEMKRCRDRFDELYNRWYRVFEDAGVWSCSDHCCEWSNLQDALHAFCEYDEDKRTFSAPKNPAP